MAASASVCKEQNTIHIITEVDVSKPRQLIREQAERTGEQLSLTAYITACLSRAVSQHHQCNAMRRGNKVLYLEDVTVSVLVERDFNSEKTPEPVGIASAQTKSVSEIHQEIRAATSSLKKHLGALSGMGWMRFIPSFLLRFCIRMASRSVAIVKRYGVVSVTSIGMFGTGAMWPVPLSGATVTLGVGSIVLRPVVVGGEADGRIEEREHLCLTIALNHDLIDGAPGARFATTLAEILSSGDLLRLDSALP